MKYSTLTLLVLIVLAATAGAVEQPSPADSGRPKIGLALGGGSARGAAHVGVLRQIEELGIPIDYVAGTSMGSVVGSLYALGLTPDQIEAALTGTDWADIFSDRTRRQDRSMRRKEDDSATFFPLEFGFRNGRLASPRGFIAGQKFAFAFDAPGLLTTGHASFDDLPIPFRAVATDLESGDIVVLDRGHLIRAVRASMAIPGVFPPVEHDGLLLVDGFLASNVPVDVVRSMGADIVIAVDVGIRPEAMSREQLETLTGITLQMDLIQSALSVRDESARADILIHPVVDDWTGTEFDRMGEIIPLGEEAAREARPLLEPLAVSPEEYRQWRTNVRDHDIPHPNVSLIVLDNRTRIDDQVIRGLIRHPVDAPLDLALLRRDLEEIYELGLIEMVDFDLDHVEGYDILTITVHEKPYSPVIIHFGGAYSLGYDGASSIILHARLNYREVNRLGAEWRTDYSVGQITGVLSEFYQPLDFGRHWFAAGSLLADYRINSFIDGGFTLGQYRYTRTGGKLSAGYNIRRFGELSAGFQVVNHHTSDRAGVPPEAPASDVAVGPTARVRIDRLDDPRIPRTGFAGNLTWSGPRGGLGADARWDRLWGDLIMAHSFGRTTVLGKIQGGSDLGSDMPYYRDFYLGGLRSLAGYRIDHLRGRAFGVGSLGLLQRLGGGSLPFASRYYLGLWFDAGNAWEQPADASLADLVYCGALSFILDSPLGPLEVGYGLAEGGDYAFHLNFGIHFATPSN